MSAKQTNSQTKREPLSGRLLAILTEVWIFGVITAFLVIRILGSGTAAHFLHKMGY